MIRTAFKPTPRVYAGFNFGWSKVKSLFERKKEKPASAEKSLEPPKDKNGRPIYELVGGGHKSPPAEELWKFERWHIPPLKDLGEIKKIVLETSQTMGLVDGRLENDEQKFEFAKLCFLKTGIKISDCALLEATSVKDIDHFYYEQLNRYKRFRLTIDEKEFEGTNVTIHKSAGTQNL